MSDETEQGEGVEWKYWKFIGAADIRGGPGEEMQQPIWIRSPERAWRKYDLSVYRKRREHPCDGEKGPGAKLKNSDIPVIMSMYNQEGLTQTEIAQRFGVSMWAVSRIIRGKSFKSIERPSGSGQKTAKAYAPRGEKSAHTKLTKNMVIEARRMYKEGKSINEIARHFGVNATSAHNFLRGKTWAHVNGQGGPVLMRSGVAARHHTEAADYIRSEAVRRVLSGELQKDVALSLCVHKGSISRWVRAAKASGEPS